MTSAAAGGPVGVVLAAGRGARFGGSKQVALLAGEPLVAHAVRAVVQAGLPVLVVTGPDGADVVAAARPVAPDLATIANPDPSRGMGSSLAVAARAAGRRPLVVVLADQPGVPAVDLHRVAVALAAGATAVRTRFGDGGVGHPVGFASVLHDDLVGLVDEGAGRDLLARHDAVSVVVDHPRPPDVDTEADLDALARTWRGPTSPP